MAVHVGNKITVLHTAIGVGLLDLQCFSDDYRGNFIRRSTFHSHASLHAKGRKGDKKGQQNGNPLIHR